MQSISTIGLDIAKSVFQVRRQLRRRQVLAFFQKLPPCLVGIEACASSHHWSRELQALAHTVRLMPPAYMKPYVKRQKNDATDAEAICEASDRDETSPPGSGSCRSRTRVRTSLAVSANKAIAICVACSRPALAVIRYAKIHGTGHRPWLTGLLARRPTKAAAIALANKIARMAWAMMARGERYKEPIALAAQGNRAGHSV